MVRNESQDILLKDLADVSKYIPDTLSKHSIEYHEEEPVSHNFASLEAPKQRCGLYKKCEFPVHEKSHCQGYFFRLGLAGARGSHR